MFDILFYKKNPEGFQSFNCPYYSATYSNQSLKIKLQGLNNLYSILFRMNLYDFGKFLQSHGLVNAINLDGGGSTTFVENGSVVNNPSDQW